MTVNSLKERARQWRKRPVVIEASQWFKNGDHPADYDKNVTGCEKGQLRTWSSMEARELDWEGQVVRYFRRPDVPGEKPCQHCGLTMHVHGWIDTTEGGHIVCPGDWIIAGVAGERYPCKPDIFAATYEPVTATERQPSGDGDLHVILCQACELLNQGNHLDAHDVIRKALVSWAEAQASSGDTRREFCSICEVPVTLHEDKERWISNTPYGRKVVCHPKFGDQLHRVEQARGERQPSGELGTCRMIRGRLHKQRMSTPVQCPNCGFRQYPHKEVLRLVELACGAKYSIDRNYFLEQAMKLMREEEGKQ